MTSFKRCQTCSRKIRSWNPLDIKRHLEICPTYFANIRSLKGQQIKCNLCAKILTDFRSAYHHLSITHFKDHFPRKLTRCLTCKKELKARNHTVICEKYFHLVKEFSHRWKCKVCNKSAFSQKEIYMHVHRSHGKSRSTTEKQNGSAEDTFLQNSSSCTSNIKNSSLNEVNMTDTNTTGIVGDTAEDPDEEITEVFKCTCCGKHFRSFNATEKHLIKTHIKDFVEKIIL